MKELYKDIKGYEGLYRISNLGNVKSLIKGIILKPNNDTRGYPYIKLHKNAKCITQRIHRLMALYFMPNPNNLPQVNHINGIKTDNRLHNLEWCTNSENQKHSYKLGLIKPQTGYAKYEPTPILRSSDNGEIQPYKSMRELVRMEKVARVTILKAIENNTKHNGNYYSFI